MFPMDIYLISVLLSNIQMILPPVIGIKLPISPADPPSPHQLTFALAWDMVIGQIIMMSKICT